MSPFHPSGNPRRRFARSPALLAAALPAFAQAAVLNPNPADGETVTVNASTPNPSFAPVVGPDPGTFTVNVLSGATLRGHVRVTGGVTLNNAGTIGALTDGTYALNANDYTADITVHNDGVMQSDEYALNFNAGSAAGFVRNTGTIRSNSIGIGAFSNTGGLTIVNSGTIEGTHYAIAFSEADDRLILEPGSVIVGRASDAFTTDTDTLTLGGDSGADAFDLDRIDDPMGFRRFEAFTKEGESTWTVTGGHADDWTVSGGTLIVAGTLGGTTTLGGGRIVAGNDDALGPATLRFTGDAALASDDDTRALGNDIDISTGVDFTADGDDDLTLTGAISGGGKLQKAGGGTLTLTGESGHAGGTDVQGGTLRLDGGGLDHAAGRLYVGTAAGENASLLVENGGSVRHSFSRIGDEAGSVGRATVTGVGSTWTQTLGLRVGNEGQGTLHVAEGGSVSVAGFASIGHQPGGTGVATIDGETSAWTNGGPLFVGRGGGGTLTVSAGAGLTAEATARVGSEAGSVGVATVEDAGSRWDQRGGLEIGDAGTGTLTVRSGGTLTVDSYASIGDSTGGIGTAIVTGAGSAWSNAGPLHVGYDGDGTLEVRDGAAFGADSSARLGTRAGAVGAVLLTGAGSAWTGGGGLQVGDGGTGTLTIADGASLATGGFASIGDEVGGAGTVSVTGPGSDWTNAERLYVGFEGRGSLVIDDGAGLTNNAAAAIGAEAGGVGDATVRGAGSAWENADPLDVGDRGTGSLTIAEAGVVSIDGGAGTLNLAKEAGSTGTLNFGSGRGSAAAAPGSLDAGEIVFGIGVGEVVFNHTADDFVLAADFRGSGSVAILAGTTTLTGDSTFTGPTAVDSGATLVNNGSLASAVRLDGGTLMGSGSLGGIDARGGRVAPGNSIGTLTVDGDVSLDAGTTYEVELHGDGTGDRIDATGAATLAGGTALAVEIVGGGGRIRHGDRWTVLSADAGVTDGGARVTGDLAGYRFLGGVAGNDYRVTAEAIAIAPSLRDPDARHAAAALDADAAAGTASPGLAGFIQATRNQSVADAERVLAATNPRAVPATRLAQRRVTDRFHATLGGHLQGQRGERSARGASQLASAFDDPYSVALLLALEESGATRRRGGPAASPAPGRLGTVDPNWGGFAAAWGVHDDRDAGDRRSGSQAVTNAAQVGVDYAIARGLLAGVSFSYAHTDLDLSGRGPGPLGGDDVDTYRIGPYLGYRSGPWSASASVTYALHDHEATRSTPARDAGFTAGYASKDVAAFLGGGYDVDLGPWRLRPEAGLQYVHTWADAYAESGGPGALAVEGSESDSLRSTLGLNVSRRFELGDAVLVPHATVGWAREHLGDDDAPAARFVGGSTAFTVSTASRDDDSLYYGAGLTALFTENLSLDVGYLGERFSDGRTDAVRIALRLAF